MMPSYYPYNSGSIDRNRSEFMLVRFDVYFVSFLLFDLREEKANVFFLDFN